MKKNLTFLMMLMAFVGIAFAQSGPKFNYSAVLRHADTLYHNNTVDVTITVYDGTGTVVLEECHTGITTTDNGFLSIVIGEGGCHPSEIDLSAIEWKGASIHVEYILTGAGYQDLDHLVATVPVVPVPFALQADGAILTTENIADYMKNTLTIVDANSILYAFTDENLYELQEAVEHAIEEYLKTEDAKERLMTVAKFYLKNKLTVNDAQAIYNTLNANTAFKNRIKELVKDYVTTSGRLPFVADAVAEYISWYLDNTAMADVREDVKGVYHSLQSIAPAEKQAIKATVKQAANEFLNDYVATNAFKNVIKLNMGAIASDLGVVFVSIDENDALGAFAWFSMYNSDVKAYLRDDVLNGYINTFIGNNSENNFANLKAAVQTAITKNNLNNTYYLNPTDCGAVIDGVWTLDDGVTPGVCTLKALQP
jgi:hypothetical protein